MKLNLRIAFPLCIFMVTSNLHAQEFEDFVSKYTGANGQGYMQPLADAFGANLNSGWYHNAYIRQQGFQLYLGVSAMSAMIPDDNKTFRASTQGFFTPEQTAQAATIFGGTEPKYVEGDDGTVFVLPGGLDMQRLPLAVPNLTIGSLFGTSASFRWMAYDLGDEVGTVSLLGWGLRHSLDSYLPPNPLNVAVGFYMQQFDVGDVVDASGWLASAQASYQWRMLTFYGGLGYENSTLDIQYTYEADDSEIAFDLAGNNALRATLGMTLNLGPVKINTDYNLAHQSIFTLGLGLGFNETEKLGE